jgi:hypothetical protein
MKIKHSLGRITAAGLGLLLLTGGVWVGETALRPPVAQAYKNRVDVRLDRLRDETYQSLIRRAEIVARAAAQRSFDRDILMSEVSVMVIGEYQGAEAPLLMLEVSRQNWRQRPDTRRWATYYRTARTLLKLPSAPDPARPNAGPGQAIDQGIPNVEPIAQPIPAPQTVPPSVPVVDAPDVIRQSPNGGAAAPTPTVVPVPTPSASPAPTASPNAVPTPSATPATSPQPLPAVPPTVPKAVPQTAPKAAPKPAKPAKPKPAKAKADADAKAKADAAAKAAAEAAKAAAAKK